jgi:hypothetical protein
MHFESEVVWREVGTDTLNGDDLCGVDAERKWRGH